MSDEGSRSWPRTLLGATLVLIAAITTQGSRAHSAVDDNETTGRPTSRALWSGLGWVQVRAWPITLTVCLIGFTALTIQQWPSIPSAEQPIAPTGGLGLYIEDSETSVNMTATAAVEMRSTGFDGVDAIVIRLKFTNPSPGARWFFLASGMYASSSSLELNAFCAEGGSATKIDDQNIKCENRMNPQLPGVSYHWGDTLGFLRDGSVYPFTDGLVDFDPSQPGVVVSGVVSDDTFNTYVWIPVDRSTGAPSGSRVTYSYPGIGGGVGASSGTENEPVVELSSQHEDSTSMLAFTSNGVPVRMLALDELSFEVPERHAPGRVEWSSPPTDEPETLRWTSDSNYLAPVSFTLYDVNAESEIVRRTFRSGILATISVGLALLLVEYAFHRNRASP